MKHALVTISSAVAVTLILVGCSSAGDADSTSTAQAALSDDAPVCHDDSDCPGTLICVGPAVPYATHHCRPQHLPNGAPCESSFQCKHYACGARYPWQQRTCLAPDEVTYGSGSTRRGSTSGGSTSGNSSSDQGAGAQEIYGCVFDCPGWSPNLCLAQGNATSASGGYDQCAQWYARDGKYSWPHCTLVSAPEGGCH